MYACLLIEIAKCCQLWNEAERFFFFFENRDGMKNSEGGEIYSISIERKDLIIDYFASMIEGFFENFLRKGKD